MGRWKGIEGDGVAELQVLDEHSIFTNIAGLDSLDYALKITLGNLPSTRRACVIMMVLRRVLPANTKQDVVECCGALIVSHSMSQGPERWRWALRSMLRHHDGAAALPPSAELRRAVWHCMQDWMQEL